MSTRRRYRPALHVLEDRCTPSVLSYTAPTGNGADAILLRLSTNGNKLELYDNGVLAAQQVLSTVDGVAVTGAAFEPDSLTLDYSLGTFSVPVSFNGGASPGDAIAVSADADFTLSDGTLTSTVGSSITLIGVEEAALTGGPSENTIDASDFSGQTTLDGQNGDDKIAGGHGIDIVLGGTGDDTLISVTGGDDKINGGLDNDTYLLDPGSTITVIDDGGNDTVTVNSVSTGGVTVVVGASSGVITENNPPPGTTSTIVIGTTSLPTTIETIIGTNQDDTFTATNTTDPALQQTFVGGAGNDGFTDQATAQLLTFVGGAQPGSAMLGGGDDLYVLNPGSVIVVIDDGGTDTVNLGTVTAGGAVVTLGDTSGTVTVPGGSAILTGAFENVVGTSFDDSITGNTLDNNLLGGGGNDTVIGGGGNDFFDGGAGSDTLKGGAGSDFFKTVPGSTEFIIDGGGVDTISFADAHFGITLNLASSGNQTIDAAGNHIQLVGVIENVIGTPFDDVINGNNADNVLVGLAGDDRLSGHSGRDILIGGAGSDRLGGGADDDILIGGITTFDNHIPALLAVQAEWTSARGYATRVGNLRGPGTDPRLNGDFFLKVSGPNRTVFDDGAVDTLTGSQQLDWFFLLSNDVLTDQNQNEFVN